MSWVDAVVQVASLKEHPPVFHCELEQPVSVGRTAAVFSLLTFHDQRRERVLYGVRDSDEEVYIVWVVQHADRLWWRTIQPGGSCEPPCCGEGMAGTVICDGCQRLVWRVDGRHC